MTPNDLMNRYWLARIIGWRHELELLDAETVAALIKILKSANSMLRQKIAEELPSVWSSYTAEKGGAAVKLWLSELLTDPATQVENTITEAWVLSGQSSLSVYNDILSFGGLAKNVVTVPITMEVIRGLADRKLFAGYTLGQLVAKAFTEGQIANVIEALDNGIKQGWGYQKILKDLNKTALDKGLQISQRESITLARSYVQQASVNAQLSVYEANKDIVQGVEWCAILDSHVCRLCAATDGNHYTFSEEKPPMPRHPRCFLPQSRLYAPDAFVMFKAQYDGPAYRIILANGAVLFVTARHPILTNKGFIPAYQIDQDTLIWCNDKHRGRGYPAERIYQLAYDKIGHAEMVDITQASLHGDGYYAGDSVELLQGDMPHVSFSDIDERFELYEMLGCGRRYKSIYELFVDPHGMTDFWKKKSWLSLQPYRIKEKFYYQGPVYDFQTLSTLYYADTAIVSNCRCLWLPWVKSWRELGIDADELEKAARPWLVREEGNIDAGGNRKILNYGKSTENFSGWWKTLPYEQQIKSIGPIRTKLINSGQLTWKGLMNRNTGRFYTLAELGFDEAGKKLL